MKTERLQEAGSPSTGERRVIEAVKQVVRIETVARDYGEFKVVGDGRLLGRCVSQTHEDKTPSLTIYTGTQTFKCYGVGCGAQGDVVDLVRLAEGGETWEAMISLGLRYDVPLPERPASWYGRQARQRPVRDQIDAHKIDHLRCLIFRLIWMPWLKRLPDSVREQAKQDAWEISRSIALKIYTGRRGA